MVQDSVEILVRFTQPAATVPFMVHGQTLKHEDAGMMGQLATTS